MQDRLSAIAEQIRQSARSNVSVSRFPLRVHMVTMGCAKNEVDSADMARLLSESGAFIVDDPSSADCIIVNTCSFIQAATEESIAAVFEMCGMPRVESGEAKVVVAGCMPARYGDDLSESLNEAASFVPCSKEDDIVSIVGTLFPGRLGSGQLALSFGSPSTYVKISDGCDRFCSFCTIPFIRGRYHSYTYDRISEDVARSVSAGAREIVLIAQDTGRWGTDLRQSSSLAELTSRLAESYEDTWFRIMYVQPEGVTDELLDVMASHANVASYLDVPLQHCVPSVLKAMNRKGDADAYADLIARIRNRVPDVALRTTLIAGFPGETEKDFEELCAFVESADFDYVGVFAYSREDGTRAAILDDQVDEDEKRERADRLRDVADAVSHARIQGRIGSEYDVLVLGREEDGQLFGRAMCQAPDVDGVVYLNSGEVGSVVRATVEDTLMYDMEATVTEKEGAQSDEPE